MPDRHVVNTPFFVLALIAAPLVPGLLAAAAPTPLIMMNVDTALLAFPLAFIVAGTVLGAPTYLLFGGPAFYLAVRRSGAKADMVPPAIMANLASAPFLLLGFFLAEGVSFGTALTTLCFVLLGCGFGSVWGMLFSRVYNALLARVVA